MTVTYLALSSVEQPFARHRQAQQATWANSTTNTFWLMGDGSSPGKVICDGNSLIVGVPEIFENILEKTILSLRWCLENISSDFYVRTNTSTYIRDSALARKLSQLDPNEHYAAAAFGKTDDKAKTTLKNQIFLAGNMMVFSRKTAETLGTLDAKDFKAIPDDVAISLYLQSHGIEFTESERNDLTDYKGFKPCVQHRVKSWSNSDETINRMHEVHRIYTSYGIDKLKSFLFLYWNEILRYKSEFPPTNGKRVAMNIKNFLRQTTSLCKSIFFNPRNF